MDSAVQHREQQHHAVSLPRSIPLQAAHPALKGSHELQLFLEASETEFAIEVSRSQVDDSTVTQVGRAECS